MKIHYFNCQITEFHKKWINFQVTCGRTLSREKVTDDYKEVTCQRCRSLMEHLPPSNVRPKTWDGQKVKGGE